MKAFISYSHNDSPMLDILHKHLAQLKREAIITTWTDNDILAGGNLHINISTALNSSNLFIALLSPDYIASGYCYEKEFQKALETEKNGNLVIIPIILEPCDWLNAPFKDFKALPKDGKPVSTWENKNTAFLNVIQGIRKLIEGENNFTQSQTDSRSHTTSLSRNYRVQKDFDSIQKMEFVENSFHDVKEFLKRYLEEIQQLENIKARILIENSNEFKCLLVNRNKVATESELKVSTSSDNSAFHSFGSTEKQINYIITQNNRPSNNSFKLTYDEYHMFWSQNNFSMGSRQQIELGSKEIADTIWNEWLESVGIL